MTIEELLEAIRGEFHIGNILAAVINGHMMQAVAEAVAAKEAELVDLRNRMLGHSNCAQLGCCHEEAAKLQAELAAVRVPVGPVTLEEARQVHGAWAVAPYEGFLELAAEIDNLIAPRVAQAVAAERDSQRTALKVKDDQIMIQEERHAAELAKEKERRTYYQSIVYHVCNWIDKTLGNSGPYVVSCGQLDAPSDGVQHALDRITRELAASDQRWQERLKAVEAGAERAVVASQEKAGIELTTEKANWQARLERVEAEHAKVLQEVKASARDKIQKGSWRVVELTIQGVENRFTERMAKAVSEAYEQCVGLVAFQCLKDASLSGVLNEIIADIRQLAAKPQEKPCGACGKIGCTVVHADELAVTHDFRPGAYGDAPKFPDCDCGLTEAHDPPPKKPYAAPELREYVHEAPSSVIVFTDPKGALKTLYRFPSPESREPFVFEVTL